MVRPIDFSNIAVRGDLNDFMEKRFVYSGSNLEYIGWTQTANASTSAPVWFIVKNSYNGSNITRQQLPDDGPYFKYVFDDRATYFS